MNEIQLIFHRLFWKDVEKASGYYKEISIGLAFRFNNSVLEALEKVRANPENYFNISNKNRRILIDKFPYSIVYSFKDHIVRIAALKHAKSITKSWESRERNFRT